jgi:two-component system nitrogen regulation sensor histidine kinase NtrY
MKEDWTKIWDFIRKHAELCIAVTALLLYALSFVVKPDSVNYGRAASRVENQLHKRQKILDHYAQKAIEIPADQWISFQNFPEDMVLYRYNSDPFYGDTLQSWINRFPISNDEIDVPPVEFRLNYLTSNNLYATPLAYIGSSEQYVNLGSAWYVVKSYEYSNSKIITGLLIKNETPVQVDDISGTTNKRLRIDRHMTTEQLTEEDGSVIKGVDGNPLFTLSLKGSQRYVSSHYTLKWIAFILAIMAAFLYLYRKRTLKAMMLSFIVITGVRFLAMVVTSRLSTDTKLFSPLLYADSSLFHSLGDLLLNNLYVVMMVLAMFMSRRAIMRAFENSSKGIKWVIRVALICVCLFQCVYIHLTLRSLLLNSSLVLDLSRLTEISFYSVLCYFSYALLFAILLMSLRMSMYFFNATRDVNLFSLRNTLIYIAIVTLYSVIAISGYGLKKEYEQNRVWTNKLSIQRDLNLELQLCSVEQGIASDAFIGVMTMNGMGNELIKNTLLERYLYGPLLQNYNVTITTCSDFDLLRAERNSDPVNCFGFYQDQINKFGTEVLPGSRFYFMNNYNGRIGYLGVFTFVDLQSQKVSRMFLEIDSKYVRDDIGYPLQIFAYKQNDKVNLPRYYSHATYYDGRLQSYEGGYNYPVTFKHEVPKGYSMQKFDKYIHFVNKISDDNIIIISRPRRSIFPYLVTFSYLFLFFALVIILLTYNGRKEKLFDLPRHSFRSKITILLTVSLVFALLCIGIGSVMFSLSQSRNMNKMQMEQKLNTVQSTLTDYCKYALRYNDINTPELFDAMDRVASNTQSDINLYDPHGLLVRTTKTEVFEQYLLGCRINPEAFDEIIHNDSKSCVLKEKIAGISYYSLYAPVFNAEGLLVAIANIPYFSRSSDMEDNASHIVAAIINIYLLLLIAAVLGGLAISNQLTKPLEEIGSKMKSYDLTQKVQHIDYKGNDEIGQLVTSYNKMVDDLDESTKRLAQSERDSAWREMARQIAHEIKNPLTPMRLSIQQLMRLKQMNYPGWEDKLDKVFNSLLEQIDILSQTATEFSSFAKFYNEEVSRIDLISLLKEQVVLYNTDDSIVVDVDSQVPEAWVLARKSQIIRVFVNLLSNAVQAIKNDGITEGRVLVTVSSPAAGTAESAYYELKFEDNGPGVSEENLDKLFKPNFTTKSSGTGLGLAICRSIIEQSQGTIRYEKSSLGGAAFIVDLPA